MFLDFNAIAKGYGVDLISNLLKANCIDNFLIDIDFRNIRAWYIGG